MVQEHLRWSLIREVFGGKPGKENRVQTVRLVKLEDPELVSDGRELLAEEAVVAVPGLLLALSERESASNKGRTQNPGLTRCPAVMILLAL